MSKNIFLMDKQDTMLADSNEMQESIAHNESIAENFLKLMGTDTDVQTNDKESAAYDNTIELLRTAFARENIEQEQTAMPNGFDLYQQLQNIDAESIKQMQNNMADSIMYDTMTVDTVMPEQNYIPQPEEGVAAEENADLMPTETTTQYAHTLYEEENKEKTDTKTRLVRSKKASILVAVGIAIMAIILALICINVGVINSLQAQLNDTYNNYNTINADLKVKQEALVEALKPETIMQNAADKLGMIVRK